MDNGGWNFLQGVFTNAVWDGIKHFSQSAPGAAMIATLVGIVLGIVKRIRNGASDLWVLGTVFVVSAIGLHISSGSPGVPQSLGVPLAPQTICAGPLEQTAPASSFGLVGWMLFGVMVIGFVIYVYRNERHTHVDKDQNQEGSPISAQPSPQDAANREKLVVLLRAHALPAYAVAQQVTDRLWNLLCNKEDMQAQTIALLFHNFVVIPCNQASETLSRDLNGPVKNDVKLLQQHLRESFDAYQLLVDWTNRLIRLFYISLRSEHPEYDMWRERHKLFYQELERLIASDDFSQLRRRLRKSWYDIQE